MNAIRKIQQVQGRTVTVELPDDFPEGPVEVIVLPASDAASEAATVPEGVRDFLTMDTSGFTETQRQAYERARALLLKGRKPDEPRIMGLFAGLMKGADDFDAPLPDEDLFYGSETDAYGIYRGPDAEPNP